MEKKEHNPNLLIFASGNFVGGGSGFEALIDAQKNGMLDANIVGAVSPYRFGGIRRKAEANGIRFLWFPGPYDVRNYNYVIRKHGGEWVALSGWLKKMEGYDPRTTFNIHPARLAFGGRGMYGIHIHRAVIDSYQKGLIKDTAVSMHFVIDEYDKGPVFFEYPVPIYPTDTPKILQERVKGFEHLFQWVITDMVIHKKISWDGKDPKSLIVPEGYRFLPKKL
ncbi:MAG: formyltransferase family protein [Candidatus Parcubacteria bacterium]|nr:formyltransferase family protein [Candidatus Parcubacteria bacterium]